MWQVLVSFPRDDDDDCRLVQRSVPLVLLTAQWCCLTERQQKEEKFNGDRKQIWMRGTLVCQYSNGLRRALEEFSGVCERLWAVYILSESVGDSLGAEFK